MPAFPSGFPSATVLLAAQMAVDQVLGNAGSSSSKHGEGLGQVSCCVPGGYPVTRLCFLAVEVFPTGSLC